VRFNALFFNREVVAGAKSLYLPNAFDRDQQLLQSVGVTNERDRFAHVLQNFVRSLPVFRDRT
jgi:hypothetical protein